MIHYAKIEESDRLRRVIRFLRKRPKKGATTREIVHSCDVMNVATCVSEINSQPGGERIVCTYERTTQDGRRVYRYRIA